MKKQIYLIGTSVCFFYYDSTALPSPTTTFFRSVPSALLSIDVSSTGDIQFSQKDNTGGLPSPFLSAPLADIVNAVGTNYVSITTLIAAITPAAGGGGGGSAPDIADWKLSIDRDNDDYLIWTLTVFDPTTNQPTRSFFELDGVTPYIALPKAVVTPDALTPTFFTKINNLEADVALIRGQLGLTTAVGGNQSLSAKIRAAGTFTIPAGARKIKIISTAVSFVAGGVTYPITTTNGDKIDFYEAEATVGRRLTALVYAVDAGGSAIELVMN